MKRVFLLTIFTTLLAFSSFSQTFTITGNIKDADTKELLPDVEVISGNTKAMADKNGNFSITVPFGAEVLVSFFKKGYVTFNLNITTDNMQEMNLYDVLLTSLTSKETLTGEDRIPIISVSSDNDDDVAVQNISGILSASRDPFVAAAAFNLSTGGFNIRGYDTEAFVFFNGIPVNNLENGAVYWSVWGGLNDVTRNRESTIDLGPLSFGFGGVGGATAFDTRAAEQRRQKRVSYMFSNRSYTGRLMGTWSTGMLKSGWAFSFSASKRWAKEGYVPGTFYNAYSYFASVDKKLGNNHLLNLTFLGAPVRRGQQGAATEEVNDLAGSKFYNPNWGYQNGEKRNARVVNAHQPLTILRHDWKLSKNASLMTAAGYQFGKYGRTSLDWFNAPDPRADYYRNLPSYYALESKAVAEEIANIYIANPDLLQIQWDKIYEANALNGQSYNNEPGKWSQYVISNQRSDTKKLNASSTYQNVITDHVTVNFGLTYQNEKTHYFNVLDDLLGGDYYTNLDRFALEESLPGQSANYNLEDENVIVRKGDTYGWDYDINGIRYGSWLQGQFSFRKVDFFLAADLSKTDFWRTGNFRNGRFPNSSFGDSEKQKFNNYGLKGGVTYKINGRNYLYANGAYLTRPPDARNAYASARNRDQIVPGLSEETVYSGEGGYQLRSPNFKGRATFYYTQFNNALKLNRFFLPGDISNFGSYFLTGLDRRHAGVELAMQAKLSPALTVNGVAAVGEYIYTSRPEGIFIQDDDGVIRERGTIYVKNFYVPGTPQTAASLGLDYRSAQFWSASVTVNYFDRTYIDFSPERRTIDQVFGLEQGSDFYNTIVDQERAPDAFTVDLFANKSYKINDDMFLYLTAGVTNLLDASVITGGYEQLRFERADVERTGINVFPSRHFYAYGTNFFLMGAVRF